MKANILSYLYRPMGDAALEMLTQGQSRHSTRSCRDHLWSERRSLIADSVSLVNLHSVPLVQQLLASTSIHY